MAPTKRESARAKKKKDGGGTGGPPRGLSPAAEWAARNFHEMSPDAWLSAEQVAIVTGHPVETLRYWRKRPGHPLTFQRRGHMYYYRVGVVREYLAMDTAAELPSSAFKPRGAAD